MRFISLVEYDLIYDIVKSFIWLGVGWFFCKMLIYGCKFILVMKFLKLFGWLCKEDIFIMSG